MFQALVTLSIFSFNTFIKITINYDGFSEKKSWKHS